METKITRSARAELVQALRERYLGANREEKARMLSEFIAVSGCHRKSAIRILNDTTGEPPEPVQIRARPRLYDEAVRQTLITLWEASDRVCGKRLRPLIGILLPAMERHGHLHLEESIRTKVLAMSAATIDRLLRETKAVTGAKPRRTVPRLRRLVPVRTFSDWKDPCPGSMEMDLVAHCGDVIRGNSVHTLTLTDIASGWTECAPLLMRESSLVVEALERVRTALPFPLVALDIDNGGEFLNEIMISYCIDHGIELTRSRPYRKNDQAWVEQKNGAVVRRLIGYRRLGGIAATEALGRLYASSRLFVNFFQPSFKLKQKNREGARVTKQYHAPQTPCQRLMTNQVIGPVIKIKLREVANSLDPLKLLDEVRAMQKHLLALADGAEPPALPSPHQDLTSFLGSLTTAWREGEVRPTHYKKPRPPRRYRTRVDPFESVWQGLCEQLRAKPDLTALDLFERLQNEHPGRFQPGQLRTLQRRVKTWRGQAARSLVYGTPETPRGGPDEGSRASQSSER